MSKARPSSRRVSRRVLFALAAATTFTVAACNGRPPTQPATPSASTSSGEKTFSSQITGYNHTDKTIGSFSVNGVWGGSLWLHANGGDTCCIQMPLPWRQNSKVKIDWEDDDGQHSRDVAVPAYGPKSLGVFNVHFLRSGEIKVFDINAFLGNPDYPLKGEEANLKPGVPNAQFPRERPASS